MPKTLMRKIVKIDEDKCDGCGQCAPNCHEGAIKIINGKAKLVADNLCDGLGACLGHCPQGAITIEERPADAFDEAAVKKHLHPAAPAASFTPAAPMLQPAMAHSGCPGSRMRLMKPARAAASPADQADRPSQLSQWPVQLTLVPPTGPIWQDADVLIAADCIPFAYPDFHEKMLAGKTLAIACPKLDDCEPYVTKLAHIFSHNAIKSVCVARMEVPCCGGLVRVVQMALEQSGRGDIPFKQIIVGINGNIIGS